MLARCQLVARRRKDAEQTAAAVVADDPTSVAAWIVVGDTRLGRNNPAAVDAYKRALAIDPTSASAANGLGSAYQRMGKRREAAGMYTQAARLAPHSTIPRRNLEQLAAGARRARHRGRRRCSGPELVVDPDRRSASLAILTVIAVPIFSAPAAQATRRPAAGGAGIRRIPPPGPLANAARPAQLAGADPHQPARRAPRARRRRRPGGALPHPPGVRATRPVRGLRPREPPAANPDTTDNDAGNRLAVCRWLDGPVGPRSGHRRVRGLHGRRRPSG